MLAVQATCPRDCNRDCQALKAVWRARRAHHSWLGSLGQLMGCIVAASTLGDLFCSSSASSSLISSPWDLLRYAFVSSLVEKLQECV